MGSRKDIPVGLTIDGIEVHCQYSELVDVSELKPHPKNRNNHSEAQIDRLCEIIKYQGVRHPIKVSNLSGFISSGHGRLLAAKKLGMKRVPVSYQDYTDEVQEYADLIADNAIASWSELDLSGINSDIGDLGPDFEIDLLGIKDFVLEPTEKLDPQCDEDEVPEHVEPKAKLGDIYQLGRHRLMCGDSTSIDAVEKLMNGEKADLCFTSPPYNGDTHIRYRKSNNKKLYSNDFDAKDSQEYIDFCHSILGNIFAVTKGFIFWNVNYNAKSRFEFLRCIEPFIESLWETIAWKKTVMPVTHGLARNFEFIFCFKGFSPKKVHLGEPNETNFNVWEISNKGCQIRESHRACFPVALPEKGILLSTAEGDSVYEPFGGSGTTLIACEKTNRTCFMMELDPQYIDLIVARWEKYTGKKAELLNG